MAIWPAYPGLRKLGRNFALTLGAAIAGTPASPEAVANVIDIETAGAWSPGRVRTHVGLLMWGPNADLPEGVDLAKLEKMTAVEQTALVGRWTHRATPILNWSARYGVRRTMQPEPEQEDPNWYADEGDVWLANFWPAGVGKDLVISRQGESIYDQNAGFAHRTPGILTTQDVADFATKHLTSTLDVQGYIDDASEAYWHEPVIPGSAYQPPAQKKDAKWSGVLVSVGLGLALAVILARRKGARS
jgi:hypothetical protein